MVDKQFKFLLTMCDFIQKVEKMGYKMTMGEGYRPPELAKLYASEGRGIANSLHTKRLAVDLDAFSGDVYLDGSSDSHIPILTKIGELWESLNPLCAWGARFSRKDYNHYSFMNEGVK